jgi:Zn-dependent M16 (insulinase) family peptidase
MNRVIGQVKIPEFHFNASLLSTRYGPLLTIQHQNDSNQVFNVTLKTSPLDSTGCPHILEHTTLCGSLNYPVRDPFFVDFIHFDF